MLKICFSLFEIFTLFIKVNLCSVESIVEEVGLSQLMGRNLARLSLGFVARLAAAVALSIITALLRFFGLLFVYLDSAGFTTLGVLLNVLLNNLSGLLVSLDGALAASLSRLSGDLTFSACTRLSTLLLTRSGLLLGFSISLFLGIGSGLLLGSLSFGGLFLHGCNGLLLGGLLLLGLISSCLGFGGGCFLGLCSPSTDSLQALKCCSLCSAITSSLQLLLLFNMTLSECDLTEASLSGDSKLLLIVPPVA